MHNDLTGHSPDASLVFAPAVGVNGAKLVASLPGDGTFNDDTALFPNLGTGVLTTIAWTDLCVSARGVVPSTASQTLFVEDCNGDPAQIWTVNENAMTVSNADGNCIRLWACRAPCRGKGVCIDRYTQCEG